MGEGALRMIETARPLVRGMIEALGREMVKSAQGHTGRLGEDRPRATFFYPGENGVG